MEAAEQAPILSSFWNDPDMLELVEEFVAALPERVSSIEQAAQASSLPDLARLAHQLKGAGGGYGFDVISKAAAELESSAKTARSVEQLTHKLTDLINLCQRARVKPD